MVQCPFSSKNCRTVLVVLAFIRGTSTVKQCMDFQLSDIRDDRRGLKVRMPDFETTLSHPRSLAERFDLRGDYKFSCSGNYLMILNVRKRITTKCACIPACSRPCIGPGNYCECTQKLKLTKLLGYSLAWGGKAINRIFSMCPSIKIQRGENLWGFVELSSVGYSFDRCIYSVQGEDGGKYQKIGSLKGKSWNAEIGFNITTTGPRPTCSLDKPTFRKNLVFFPQDFFVTDMAQMDGLNNRLIRDNIIKVINSELGSSLESFLLPTRKCSSLFNVKLM